MIEVPQEELQWSFARSGGPGGQNVNKVSSKAVLRWNVLHTAVLPESVRQRLMAQRKNDITSEGDLLITSQRHRDQEANKQDCLAKLAAILEQAEFVPRPRRPTRATRASMERRIQEKKKRAQIKLGRGKQHGE